MKRAVLRADASFCGGKRGAQIPAGIPEEVCASESEPRDKRAYAAPENLTVGACVFS